MSLKLAQKNLHDSSGDEHEGEDDHSDSNWIVSYADMMTLLAVFFIMMLSFARLDEKKIEEVKKQTVQYFGGSYKIPYEKIWGKIKDLIKAEGLESQVLLEVDESGVTASFHGAVFFESGKADLVPAGAEVLAKMGEIFQKEAQGFKIVVEGHTDDSPIQSPLFPSNWELSGSRAARVIRLFEAQGYDKSLLTAIGYGDTRPILPNRGAAGEPIAANQSQNRRVVVKILK